MSYSVLQTWIGTRRSTQARVAPALGILEFPHNLFQTPSDRSRYFVYTVLHLRHRFSICLSANNI